MYSGPQKTTNEIAILHINENLIVFSVDKQAKGQSNHKVFELLPGQHNIKVARKNSPSCIIELEFEVYGGNQYQVQYGVNNSIWDAWVEEKLTETKVSTNKSKEDKHYYYLIKDNSNLSRGWLLSLSSGMYTLNKDVAEEADIKPGPVISLNTTLKLYYKFLEFSVGLDFPRAEDNKPFTQSVSSGSGKSSLDIASPFYGMGFAIPFGKKYRASSIFGTMHSFVSRSVENCINCREDKYSYKSYFNKSMISYSLLTSKFTGKFSIDLYLEYTQLFNKKGLYNNAILLGYSFAFHSY